MTHSSPPKSIDYERGILLRFDKENWIGNYAEGYGLFGVKFAKKDCRETTDEEVKQWIKDRNSVKF